MKIILAYVTGNALGFALALFATGVLRLVRTEHKPPLIRAFSGAGLLGALYLVYAAAARLVSDAGAGKAVSTLLTSHAPLVLLALTLTILFASILVTVRRATGATIAAAVAAGIQLALSLYNLIAHWNNYTGGSMGEWLYLQLAVVVLALLSTLVLSAAARNGRKA
ncbi:MAG: hypothetical protein LBN05_02485 [Oscillospiraceae bacterium]|jgi:hypothetical protein|nr:hypothetical protein [Oscillospiraceae bacterium]